MNDMSVEDGKPSPLFSESDLADRFCERHGGELRYVAKWGSWMKYADGCWREEETYLAFDLAREVCKALARASNKKNKELKSARTFAAIEKIAKADRRIAATVDQWDTDPWLLNTPTGVVDLKTGEVRPHRPEDYMTKMTAVAPSGKCPRWLEHLKLITNGDDDLIRFLQIAFGYTLTGETREHGLFFAYGSGANGKSTTIETIGKILGSYARTAPMRTFTAQKSEEHPTDLAMLRGARMVIASETEEGRGWDESKIKTLTGGERITARFMRQDFFEYEPQFKLWLSGNHKPGLRSVDEAIRRRFHLLPFTVTIPEKQRDKRLIAKLKKEWAGILAWMIEGCLMWQKEGLNPPTSVREATREYLSAEDTLTQWFNECCVVDPKAKGLLTSELYASWKEWSEAAGEYAISQKKFSQKLEARSAELGIEKVENLHLDAVRHGRGFMRVTLRPRAM